VVDSSTGAEPYVVSSTTRFMKQKMAKKYVDQVVWLSKDSADSGFYAIFTGKKPSKTGLTLAGKRYYQGHFLGSLNSDAFVAPFKPNEGCVQVRIKIEAVD